MKDVVSACIKLVIISFIVVVAIGCGDDKSPTSSETPASTPVKQEQTETTVATDATIAKDSTVAKDSTTAKDETSTTDTAEATPSTPDKAQETEVKLEPTADAESDPQSVSTQTQDKPNEMTATKNPKQDAMLALAKKSGCLACHNIDKKIVGPAWNDVASRYAGNAGAREILIEKVSKGGKGNWTEITGGVAMPPYHPRVSKDNIGTLVDFILSLQK